MKNNIYIVFILISLFQVVSFSQCNFEELMSDLYSANPTERRIAAIAIADCDFSDALGTLEALWETEENYDVRIEYLVTMSNLGEEHITDFAYDIINDIYVPESGNYTSSYYGKLLATRILFANQDYSTYQSIYDLLNNSYNDANVIVLFSLKSIIENIQTEIENAKQWIVYISDNSDREMMRSLALDILLEKFGDDNNVIDLALDHFDNDQSIMVKFQVFNSLTLLRYLGLKNFYYSNLSLANDPSIRYRIADSLLSIFGEPSDLKTVIDYQPNEPDETARSLIGFSIKEFIPQRLNVNTSIMIDSLIEYTNELFKYGWISDDENYQDYKSLIEGLKKSYTSSDLKKMCKNIDTILENTEFQRNTSSLTEEGYKFLHYHTTYIKENIESEFGSCEN